MGSAVNDSLYFILLLIVRSCGLLDVPRSIKDNYNYSLGSTVTIQSCRIGHVTGKTQYTCTDKGDGVQEWSPPVTASCQGMSLQFSIIMALTFSFSTVVI